MDFYQNAICNLVVAVAVIIGWMRFRKADPAFLPFLLLLTVAVTNEVVSLVEILNRRSNAVNSNIYKLLEIYFLLWQFHRWNLFGGRRQRFVLLAVLLTGLWVGEVWLMNSLYLFSGYFAIVVSLVIVTLCLQQVKVVVWEASGPLWRNAIFVICTGFILYYAYEVLVLMYLFFEVSEGAPFGVNVFSLLVYVNLIVNLIFIWAVLCIPRHHRFFMDLQ